MKVISKVIAKFGENVSTIEKEEKSEGRNSYYGSDHENIIMELSEENEQFALSSRK